MKVKDVMAAPVITVAPEATFAEVVDSLLKHDVSGLLVVDHDGRLLGIVTEADLVSREAYGHRRSRPLALVGDYLRGIDPQWVRKASGLTARELMTAAPATTSPDADVAAAARNMLEAHHKRLPVVADGRVVGIVTRHDLLRPYNRGDVAIASDLEALLNDVRRVPAESHHAKATVERGIVTLTGDAQFPSDVALLEAVVARVPGVVTVDSQLTAREPEPHPAPTG